MGRPFENIPPTEAVTKDLLRNRVQRRGSEDFHPAPWFGKLALKNLKCNFKEYLQNIHFLGYLHRKNGDGSFLTHHTQISTAQLLHLTSELKPGLHAYPLHSTICRQPPPPSCHTPRPDCLSLPVYTCSTERQEQNSWSEPCSSLSQTSASAASV